MAKNKIQIDVEVNGKMEKATVSTKKLKKALDGATESQENLNASTRRGYRAAQGSAQNTSNGTKAFAKQAGVVGGLVPIYATFAANVFAVSAAFNVLRRAAAVEQLTSSLERLGAAAGRNLPAIATDLKAITGAAVSTEQALRATAVATSSGFSQAQLLGLTKVARGAATALGRDVGDALDRLVRGTAKLEPEILDELGIIVRLDQAASDYATSIGKTAQQLTQFEKTQAFVNATITQGLNKYEEVAKVIDPNPYDKLAAAFDNVSKGALNFANTVAGPIVSFLSASPTALVGVLVLFSSTLFKQLTPAIQDFTENASKRFKFLASEAKKNAVKIQTEFSKAAQKLQTLDFAPKKSQELKTKAQAVGLTDREVLTFQRSLRAAIALRQKAVVEIEKAIEKQSGKELAASQKQLASTKAETMALREQLNVVNQLSVASQTRAAAGPQAASAAATNTKRQAAGSKLEGKLLNKIDNQGAFGALGTLAGSIPLFIKNAGKAEGAAGKLSTGLSGLASVGRLSVATFGKLIPVIGQLTLAYSILKEPILKLISLFPTLEKALGLSKAGKNIQDSIDRFKVFTTSAQILQQVIRDTGSEFTKTFAKLKVAGGVFDEVSQAVTRLSDTLDEQRRNEISGNLKTIANFENFGSKAGRTYAALSKQAKAAEKANIDLFKSLGSIDQASAKGLLVGALGSLGDLNTLLPGVKQKFTEIQEALESGKGEFFNEDGTVNAAALVKALADASDEARRFEGNVKSATSASQDFFKEITKLSTKTTTPYDSLIEKVEEFEKSFNAVGEQLAKDLGDPFKALGTPIEDLKEQFPQAAAQAEFLAKKLKQPLVTMQDLGIATETYKTKLTEANDILRDKLAIQAKEQAQLDKINKLREVGAAIIPLIQKQEDRVLDSKINALDAEKSLVDLTVDEAAGKLKIANLDAQIAALSASRKTKEEKIYEQVQGIVEEKNREIDLSRRALDVQKEALRIEKERAKQAIDNNILTQKFGSRTFGSREEEVRKTEELKALKDQQAQEIINIKAAGELKKQQVLVEYTLLDAKYAYLQAESEATARRLRDEASELKNKEGATDADRTRAVEIELSATGLDTAAQDLQNLRNQFGLLRDENGLVTGGTKEGLLSKILGNINSDTGVQVDALALKIKQLGFEVSQFDTIEKTFNAAATTLREELGGALGDIFEGTKSVKEGFADLASSILKSMQRVLLDRVAEDFVDFLTGASEGTIFERVFKPKTEQQPAATTPAAAPAAQPTGGFFSPSGGAAALSQGANAAQPPQAVQTAMTGATGMMGGSGGVDGFGLGASPMNPLYVAIVQDPMMAGAMGQAQGGAQGILGAAAGATESVPLEGPNEEEKQKTQEGLLESIKSLDTATLATGAAVTGLIGATLGNTKAGQLLQKVSMALQAVILAQTLWDKFMGPVEQTSTNANTAALAANTAALAANTASAAVGFARNGAVFSGTSTSNLAGYATGGIARGAQGGFPAILHGTEAVVPLPNGKSIPVEVSGSGGGMQQNNVNVNVVMNSDGSTSQGTTEQQSREAAQLGKNISLAVQEELKKQKRSGGMLSPYGVA